MSRNILTAHDGPTARIELRYQLTERVPVRWAALLAGELEEVVPEEDGHLVVLQQLSALGVFSVAAVKDVERAIVTGGLQVFHVVLHLHLHRVAVVVLATLELLVTVFALEALQGPLLAGRPRLLAALQHHWPVGTLKTPDELVGAEVVGIHALHVVLEHGTYMSYTSKNMLPALFGSVTD